MVNLFTSDLDDHFDVRSELLPVTANWMEIGIALRLNPDHLRAIEAECRGDPTACLNSVVAKWLKGDYNVERFGRATWRQLVEALGHPAGGANKALARTIAEKHKAGGMLMAMPPALSPGPSPPSPPGLHGTHCVCMPNILGDSQ